MKYTIIHSILDEHIQNYRRRSLRFEQEGTKEISENSRNRVANVLKIVFTEDFMETIDTEEAGKFLFGANIFEEIWIVWKKNENGNLRRLAIEIGKNHIEIDFSSEQEPSVYHLHEKNNIKNTLGRFLKEMYSKKQEEGAFKIQTTYILESFE